MATALVPFQASAFLPIQLVAHLVKLTWQSVYGKLQSEEAMYLLAAAEPTSEAALAAVRPIPIQLVPVLAAVAPAEVILKTVLRQKSLSGNGSPTMLVIGRIRTEQVVE